LIACKPKTKGQFIWGGAVEIDLGVSSVEMGSKILIVCSERVLTFS